MTFKKAKILKELFWKTGLIMIQSEISANLQRAADFPFRLCVHVLIPWNPKI